MMMYSKIFQKLLMLDDQSISKQGRTQTVVNLCEKIAYYSLEILDPIADGDSVVDPSIIDLKNAYAHARYFQKRLLAKLPKKSKIPKTNEEFAKALLEQDISNPDFLFDSKISFNITTDFQDPTSGVNVFERFGLSFKLCPAGIYQRPVEIHDPHEFAIDDTDHSKVLKIQGFGSKPYTPGRALVKKNGNISTIDLGRDASTYIRIGSATVLTYKPSDFEKEYSALLGDFQVQISKPFWVLDAEITTQLFKEVMGYTFTRRVRYDDPDASLDKFLFMPEGNVDWDVAILFCNQLSKKLGLKPCYLDKDMKPILSILDYYDLSRQTNDPSLDWLRKTDNQKVRYFCADLDIIRNRDGLSLHYPREMLYLEGLFHPKDTQINWDRSANGFRLLSDAEWLWACQGLSNKPYAGSENLDDVAWYYNNSGNKNQQGQSSHIIKGKQANPWGLYDMLGNVGEWCFDFGQEYKTISNPNYRTTVGSVFDNSPSLTIPIWDMDKLKGLANSFRKDYYFGKPEDVSILQSPSYEMDYRKHMGDKYDFRCRSADRWSFVTHGGSAYQNPLHSGSEKRQVPNFSVQRHSKQLNLYEQHSYGSYYTTNPDPPQGTSLIGFRICKNAE